jgi:hypothetical protein
VSHGFGLGGGRWLSIKRAGPGEIPLEPPVAIHWDAHAAHKGDACFWRRRSFTLAHEHRCAIPGRRGAATSITWLGGG